MIREYFARLKCTVPRRHLRASLLEWIAVKRREPATPSNRMGDATMKLDLAFIVLVALLGTGTGCQRAAAQVPPELGDKLRSVGRVIDVASAAALYAPMHKPEPYAGVRVLREVGYGPAEA